MFKRGEVGGAGARPRVEVISGRCGEGQEDCLKNWGGVRGNEGPKDRGRKALLEGEASGRGAVGVGASGLKRGQQKVTDKWSLTCERLFQGFSENP